MSIVTIEGVEQQATPGNLNAHLTDGKLLLPRDIAQAFRRHGVRTAEDLISYMQSFPSGAAETLHWSMQDVKIAYAKLRRELIGPLGKDAFRSTSRPNPSFGARDPGELP